MHLAACVQGGRLYVEINSAASEYILRYGRNRVVQKGNQVFISDKLQWREILWALCVVIVWKPSGCYEVICVAKVEHIWRVSQDLSWLMEPLFEQDKEDTRIKKKTHFPKILKITS